MSGRNRPARLNRSLLAGFGIVLVAAGMAALAVHFGRVPRIDPQSPLVPNPLAPPVRMLWVVVAMTAIVGLMCLRWLATQVNRMPKAVQWRARAADSGVTALNSTVAADPVAADVESYDGVVTAAAWLSGHGRRPELHLLVTVAHDADLTELRRRIRTHAVPRLRKALEVDQLPVSMELHFAK